MIREIKEDKKRYMELLLLGDEQESMIDRYLDRGTMYVYGGGKAVCVVTDEGGGILEIKNIAVAPESQRKGCGKMIIAFIENEYKGKFRLLRAGTGDSPATVPFYESCGFERAYVIKDFFIDNYDHPIYECGVRLRDMVYFEKRI